jgi:hypothetical protein
MDVDRLFTSLKQTFSQKIPGGLSQEATSRLNRSLRHYIQQGGSESDILRETYSSMAAWLKRNSGYLAPVPEPKKVVQEFRQTPLTMASFDSMADYTTGVTMPEEDTESPLDKFERIKARRAQANQGLDAIPTGIVDLSPAQAAVTRPAFFKQPQPSVQPKDFLLKQEDIVKYRESEFNMILNSKDRDWVNNTKENRYTFAVQLDSASKPQGTNSQVSITNRFRNITKIEFVKVILPVEGLDVVVQRDCGATGDPDASLSFVSVLATPFITIVMDEMTGNNYGTNDKIDKSLAVCQYDATWKSETTNTTSTTSRGYTVFIPKFMKAQRIYAPTPLASLQKMSFNILNPENAPLSTIPDAVSIISILFGKDSKITSCYKDVNSEYLFIQTKEWFPLWSFSTLDRIQFAGLNSGNQDLIDWLQQEQGHVVVQTAYNASPTSIVDGTNAAGYANYIIIRNRFNDPKTGSATRLSFVSESTVTLTQGAALNLNRQVQLTLRVTVRELDSTTNLRPDNV